MRQFALRQQPDGDSTVEVGLRGETLLNHPMYNKGSAFSVEERDAFGLRGLLPLTVSNLQQQARRAYESIARKTDPLEKYIGLCGLQDRNEVLFHHLLLNNIEEFAPIVYTPTIGCACQDYSHMFRRVRGTWITPADRGHIYELLGNAPFEEVRLIVVTDNERILGLGDQGAGGMGIPVGKLALYSAAAGIHPAMTLPISLDVGTDNMQLRADDLYVGWRQPRLRGPEYDSLVDEFVQAVKRRFPRALLQWEDFKKQNALNLLDRYRKSLPSFNDDIQGTAAVAAAGILAVARATGTPIAQQRIVVFGGGAAGVGIARQIRDLMKQAGLESAALIKAIAILDIGGLLIKERDPMEPAKKEFGWPAELARQNGFTSEHPGDLLSVVTAIRPTVLIGTSGQPGAFTEPIIRVIARHVSRPAIFPFSNPTSKSEAIPADIIEWTEGRALVATGSPFAPITYAGKMIRIGQCNNVYIFPGVGLGVLVSEAREVTDEMFTAAAQTLAASVVEADLESGALYPRLSELRRISARIAQAVVRVARNQGVGRDIPDDQIPGAVASMMWMPQYPVLKAV